MSKILRDDRDDKIGSPSLRLRRDAAVKPCPFCGNAEVGEDIDGLDLTNTHTPHYRVECFGCGVEGPPAGREWRTEKQHRSPQLHRAAALEALAKWNDR